MSLMTLSEQEENNMRKYIRHMMRIAAEKKHMKPSRAVHQAWEERQVRKYSRKCGKHGWTIRAINVAKGTAPKRKWAARIAGVL